MHRPVDLSRWSRREHFEFFSGFDEPFFSIVADVDCTTAYNNAKRAGVRFFLWYLYRSLVAVNRIEAFRYRVMGDEVVCYDTIHASATVTREDKTFGFTFIEYSEDETVFRANAEVEIAAVQAGTGLRMSEHTEQLDSIHYSAIPWINFRGLTHARHFSIPGSTPKISFGKFIDQHGRLMMPVSITVHHGLMDAWEVSQHLDLFQQLLNQSVV